MRGYVIEDHEHNIELCESEKSANSSFVSLGSFNDFDAGEEETISMETLKQITDYAKK